MKFNKMIVQNKKNGLFKDEKYLAVVKYFKEMKKEMENSQLQKQISAFAKMEKEDFDELTTEQLANLFKLLEQPESEAKKERFEKVLIKSENVDAIRAYAATLSPKDGERFYDIATEIEVIRSGDPVEICELAIKWANHRENYSLDKLEDAIIATRKDDWIYWFANNVEGANVNVLAIAIKALAPQSRYLSKSVIAKGVFQFENGLTTDEYEAYVGLLKNPELLFIGQKTLQGFNNDKHCKMQNEEYQK